jgi:hypothetical protein
MHTLALALLLAAAFLGSDPEPDARIVADPKEGGWTVEELLRTVAEYTGESIVYDPRSPRIAGRRLEFTRIPEVPPGRLFEWLRSLLSFKGLVLVPITLGDQWMLIETTAPQVMKRPIYVSEEDLEEWSDRLGVYLVSSITLAREVDADRALGAVAHLVTPGVGQVNRVSGHPVLVFADFAPKVAAMVRTARAVEAEGRQRARGLARYEELLAASMTETAARYFRERIEAIRRADGD